MPESTPHTAMPQQVPAAARAAAVRTALAAIYKALKAYTFYPEGHPLRERILASAHQGLIAATKDGPLSVVVTRTGFSFPDGRTPVEATPMTNALAQELFAREVQRLVVLPDLTQDDFTRFLAFFSLDPPKLSVSGGLSRLLKQEGVAGVVLNEIDISAVFTKVRAEQEPDPGQKPGEAPPGDGAAQDQDLDRLSQMSVDELLELMALEGDDNQYRQLARLLLVKAHPLRQERNFGKLFTVLVAMVEQQGDPSRSPASREQALAVVQQLTPGEMAEHLLDHLEDAEFETKEPVFLILKAAGKEVVDAVVRRLVAAGLKASRKPLTTALLRIGTPAEPALQVLLKDGRWQVVLAAVSILAELGSRDTVKGLAQTAYHNDGRVRMESIRALALIGGMEASAALLELVHDENQAIAQHAIQWLGNTKNARALQPLLQLVGRRDLRGRQTALKKEALHAIGRIGDRRALEPLLKLVERRFLLFPGRWNELKVIALEAIGTLGGEQARQSLTRVSAQGGHLGRIASAVLDSLVKRTVEHHE